MKSRFLIAGAVVALAIFSASAEEEQKQSTYRKVTNFLYSVAQNVGPVAKKIADNITADARQSFKDFSDDLNASKKEQSKEVQSKEVQSKEVQSKEVQSKKEQGDSESILDKIRNAEPYGNLGWHGDTGEKVPDGVFRGGRMEQ